MTTMKLMSVICAIAGLFPIFGKTVSDRDWSQVTKIVYRHSDASVAPDYYRTYTVTVTKDEVEVSVRNYSETLLTQTYPMTIEGFRTFVSKLRAAGVKKVKEKESFATGCSVMSLSLYKGDNEFFSAYKNCDGGNLKIERGNLHNLVTRYAVPGLDDLVEKTRP